MLISPLLPLAYFLFCFAYDQSNISDLESNEG